jgi:hypothetical protein
MRVTIYICVYIYGATGARDLGRNRHDGFHGYEDGKEPLRKCRSRLFGLVGKQTCSGVLFVLGAGEFDI